MGIRAAIVGLAVVALPVIWEPVLAEPQQSTHTQRTWTAWDNDGKRIGNIVGLEGPYPMVSLSVGKDLVILTLGRDGVLATSGGVTGIGLYFTSSDCSGTPFLANGNLLPEPPSPLLPTYLFGQRVFAPSGPPQTLTVRSTVGDPMNPTACISFPAYEVFTMPLQLLIDLTTQFTPPYSVR